MHPAAFEATVDAMQRHVANPHAAEHEAGWRAADAVDAARTEVARALNADADEIIFVSGGTEANNLALLGCTPLSDRSDRRRIVVGSIEHKAVLGPSRELARRGFEVVLAPVTREGVVDLAALTELVDDRTELVSIMLVNNEIGTVQPIPEVAAICADADALLHVDAAQALAWMEIDAYALGANFLSVSGHKMGGPKGIGSLFVRRDVHHRLAPSMYGGEQEEGMRPGTLPTPLCVGFGAACRTLPKPREVIAWQSRTAILEAALGELCPGAWVNGSGAYRHPGSISITFPGVDAEQLVARLQPEVAVARGSACTSGLPEPSHVLRAIGLSKAECDATVRVSTGRFTNDAEIEAATTAFARVLAELRSPEYV